MRSLYLFLIMTTLCIIPTFAGSAYAQTTIIVNSTDVCFLNYTAGVDMWRNCGIEDDWLAFAILPWEWITGGYFSMILVAIIIMFSYIKYHKASYPLLIGTVYLPISYTLFPEQFMSWAIIMAGFYFGVLITYVFIKQTKEY